MSTHKASIDEQILTSEQALLSTSVPGDPQASEVIFQAQNAFGGSKKPSVGISPS